MALLSACPAGRGQAQTRAPRTYVVREGDTLTRIARRHGTTIAAITEANRLRSERLRPGQTLVVPRAGEDPASLSARASPGKAPAAGPRPPSRVERQALARARRLDLGSVRTGQRLLAHPPERKWVVAAGRGRLRGTLRLPVDGGRLIRGWGSGEGGYHLAIDIRGNLGATIRAAERGIVAYSGDGIPGYGNFVMIVHPNGWVTAYAHNRENLVVAGQLVRRGQPIARLGNTGRSRAPHLHFMLIENGAHCDAVPLFEPLLLAHGPRAVWRGAKRPREVQCLPRSARPHPSRLRGVAGSRPPEGEQEEAVDDELVDEAEPVDDEPVESEREGVPGRPDREENREPDPSAPAHLPATIEP
jgi:murein DD-endopeptidase MepM/ murein hydrolase activator NlpD